MSNASRKGVKDLLGLLEAEVLEVLWRHGQLGVSDVLRHLNTKRRAELAYTTVMTVMGRLAEKGYLTRTRSGRAFLYEPAGDERAVLELAAGRRARALLDEFEDLAVVGFLNEVSVDPQSLALLQELMGRGENEAGN